MEKLEFHSSRISNYPIYIGNNWEELTTELDSARLFIVDRLAYKYHKNLIDTIRKSRPLIVTKSGEKSKSFSRILFLIKKFHQFGVSRKDTIFALGGGSITDSIGFLASIYMRGIPYINIPSTLLGQLDASVGGKTGVNTAFHKNMCGSFYHPSAVIINPVFLQSLSKRHFQSGIAEAIKIAVISSGDLFKYIEDNLEFLLNRKSEYLISLVKQSIEIKLRFLMIDPFENSLDRALNFGHTVGHAIELLPNRRLTHGEAISIGMCTATRYAMVNQIIEDTKGTQILELINKVGLPTKLNINADESKIINQNLDTIRMIRGGKLRFVLPNDVGSFIILDEIQVADKLISNNLDYR